jgi:hypothetical protein
VIRYRLDSSGLRYGPMAGSCEHESEPSDSIKGREILDQKATISFCRKTLFHGASSSALFNISACCINGTRFFSSTVYFSTLGGEIRRYLINNIIGYKMFLLSSVARMLRSQVRILLGAWMCVCVFLCCVVLCR